MEITLISERVDQTADALYPNNEWVLKLRNEKLTLRPGERSPNRSYALNSLDVYYRVLETTDFITAAFCEEFTRISIHELMHDPKNFVLIEVNSGAASTRAETFKNYMWAGRDDTPTDLIFFSRGPYLSTGGYPYNTQAKLRAMAANPPSSSPGRGTERRMTRDGRYVRISCVNIARAGGNFGGGVQLAFMVLCTHINETTTLVEKRTSAIRHVRDTIVDSYRDTTGDMIVGEDYLDTALVELKDFLEHRLESILVERANTH